MATKLAHAIITISDEEKPPLRFHAGVDAVATAEQVATTLQQQTLQKKTEYARG